MYTVDFVNDFSKLSPGVQAACATRQFKCSRISIPSGETISFVEENNTHSLNLFDSKDTCFYIILNDTGIFGHDPALENALGPFGIDVSPLVGLTCSQVIKTLMSWIEVEYQLQSSMMQSTIGHGYNTITITPHLSIDLNSQEKPRYSEKALLHKARRDGGLCQKCGDRGEFISLGCFCRNGHGQIF